MKKFKALLGAIAAVAMCAAVFTGCADKDNTKPNDGPCSHENLQRVDGHDANCYETGNYAYYECDDCGALFSDRNGTKPTTLKDVTIETTRHDMHRYDEPVGAYTEYYFCNSCGRYYSDFVGKNEIPYDEFCDSSVPPESIPVGWSDPAGAQAENRDFTLRCYIGWTNVDGAGFSAFPASGTVWVNVNLNRVVTLLTNDGWYNFGVAYNKDNGLQYKDFEAGHLTKVSAEFTELFVEKGGIWVRVVREGTNCSFYFEDKYGIPILISTNAHFDETEALYRFALNVAENGAVDGWTLAPAKSEICWNIANPRCVFNEK